VRGEARALPEAVQKGGPVRAALSPDGKVAAVLLEEGNRLALLQLGHGSVSLIAEMSLAPEARLPVVADVGFVADGRTLWVALGDTAKSRAVGPQPTELVAVRIERASKSGAAGGAAMMTVARRVQLPDARFPILLSTGRARPLSSGASIRLPPERATVYLTARNRSGAVTVFRLGGDDRATSFVDVAGSAGAAELSPDGRWLLVPVVEAGSGAPTQAARLAIVTVPADDHPGPRQVLDLGGAALTSGENASGGAARLPSVASQP
jgi:hypothetical protein